MKSLSQIVRLSLVTASILLAGCQKNLIPSLSLNNKTIQQEGLERSLLVDGQIEACDARRADPKFTQIIDQEYYLRKNADVRQAVLAGVLPDAITHFLCYGQFEKRKPNALYDEQYYVAANPDVAALVSTGVYPSGFFHFAKYGQNEGRKTFPPIPRWTSPAGAPEFYPFNEGYYLQENAALMAGTGFVSGLAHYLRAGRLQGAKPSAQWDEARYLALNSDVADLVAKGGLGSGLEHYLDAGRFEAGRLPMPVEPSNPSSTANTGLAPKRLISSSGDIIEVLRSETASGFVEVNVYSRNNLSGGIYRHLITPSLLVPFAVCDWQMRRDDLVCVLTTNPGSGMLELHALSAASSYREFTTHAATNFRLHDAAHMEFRFTDGDLVGIKTSNAESGRVEVHILTESSGYQVFRRHDVTPLSIENATEFRYSMVGDALALVKVANVESGMIEVHCLTGASGYRDFFVHEATSLPGGLAPDLEFFFTPAGDLLWLASPLGPAELLNIGQLDAAQGYRSSRR